MLLRRLAVAGLLLVVAVLALLLVVVGRGAPLTLDGLPKGALNAADVARTTVSVPTSGRARLLLDRREVDRTDGGTLTASLGGLRDGRHVLVVEVDRGLLPGSRRTTTSFEVDTVPPQLVLTGGRGRGEDVLHLSTSDGADVEVALDGSFAVPPGARGLVAVDDAGNQARVPTGR